jgi:uncharacterized membrane protein
MDDLIYGVLAVIIIGFIFVLMNNKKIEDAYQISSGDASINRFKERWEWVDQFRGLVVIFLIIASITWILSGKMINVDLGELN